MEFNELTLAELKEWLDNPTNTHSCVLGTDEYQDEATTGCYRCLASLCVRELQTICEPIVEIALPIKLESNVKSETPKRRRKKCPT